MSSPRKEGRSSVRWMLEAPGLGAIRNHISLRDARRENTTLNQIEKATGYHKLDLGELPGPSTTKNQTFFILGSGSSIEDLSPENFQEISEGVSVGINAWVLHDFVPTMYAYEPVEDSDTDHFWTLSYLNRPEILSSRPFVLVLKPRNPFELDQLNQVPASLLDRTRIYGRTAPYTRKQSNLVSDLERALDTLARPGLDSVLLDSGASIVRMAHLGLKLGFRRIVFVGVDLNTTEYFWERNPSYLGRRGILSFDSGQRGTTHETLNPYSRPFSVIEMIAKVSEALNKSGGQPFRVASEGSELARVIPTDTWR